MESTGGNVHSTTIIHIIVDNFYKKLLNSPHAPNEAVAITQENIIASCNDLAIKVGVKKYMTVSEALKICPGLLLVKCENFQEYYCLSKQIHVLMLSFSNRIQKISLDENYLDVSKIVNEKEKEYESGVEMIGQCIGNFNDACSCGCHKRLAFAAHIAFELRKKLKYTLGLTCCCAISYDTLLAKTLCHKINKSNEQLTLLPNGKLEFMLDCERDNKTELSFEFTNDQMLVTSGKNNLWELELKNNIVIEVNVKEKFKVMLQKLLMLIEEDKRTPGLIKVSVRKRKSDEKMSYKETKESPLPAHIFTPPFTKFNEESFNKLLELVMQLYNKIVNYSNPIHVTLLGLAFSKFNDKGMNSSVASFLMGERDLSVQSPISFKSYQNFLQKQHVLRKSLFYMTECHTSEFDIEPSPKKMKLDLCDKVRQFPQNQTKLKNFNLTGDLSRLINNLHIVNLFNNDC